MQVEREFHPVKITLETEFEVRLMRAAVLVYSQTLHQQNLRANGGAELLCETLLANLGQATEGLPGEP